MVQASSPAGTPGRVPHNLKGKSMKLRKGEKGFTLIEMIVVITILGAITGAMAMTMITTMTVSQQSNDHIIALRQVQNAGYWISRDVQMTQTINITKPGVFLALSWVDWDGNDFNVDYVFDGDRLERQLNGAPGVLISDHIVVESTTCDWDDGNNEFEATIKASLGSAEIERIYEVAPRIGLN